MAGRGFFEPDTLATRLEEISLDSEPSTSSASMGRSVTGNNVVVVVDPLLIYQRTEILEKSETDQKKFLEYELAPYPPSLFDKWGMRRTQKAALYDVFLPVDGDEPDLKSSVNVIDGGFLLHRVRWNADSNFRIIFNQYVTYIKKHYGNHCTVVFDGYTDTKNSPKRAEQKRRNATKSSVDINVSDDVVVTVQQDHFFANERNKTEFIKKLSQKLNNERIETTTAEGDADTTIVQYGVDKSLSKDNVAIIGEDIDLLVLLIALIALAPPKNEILFVKPGRGDMKTKTHSSLELQKVAFAKCILFIHGFSGCDTTSAIYRKGKLKIVKLFKDDESNSAISDVFYNCSSTHEEVSQAGEKMFLKMYEPHETDLKKQRHSVFSKKPTPSLASLPPTRGAAQQHSYRVFHQVQTWKGNQLTPEAWGWKRGVDGTLDPIMTNDPPAPDSIMKTIFCQCEADCGVQCECRKAGISCTSVSGNFEGSSTNLMKK